MKQCIFIVWLLILFSGCQSQRMVVSDAEKAAFETTNGDPVTIENEELEYEITTLIQGFTPGFIVLLIQGDTIHNHF